MGCSSSRFNTDLLKNQGQTSQQGQGDFDHGRILDQPSPCCGSNCHQFPREPGVRWEAKKL